MSYDLYLTSSRLSHDAFTQFFLRRPHYEMPGLYSNKDTGVYFQFTYQQPKPGNEPLGGEFVAFNLNYFRPHTFGLEAEPEVSAFVAAFGCTIRDPQMEGMGTGPYSADGFMRGWNKGNAFGYAAIRAKSGLDNILFADEADIEKAWRWSLRLKSRQAEIGESHYLPRAKWGKRPKDGVAVAFSVWGEGVITAFPDCVTHVLLMRKRTSPKKEEVMEARLISLDEVGALEGCGWRDNGADKLLLATVDGRPSPQVASAFDGEFTELKAAVRVYSPDHVLDAPTETDK